jgi:hypothetical protein
MEGIKRSERENLKGLLLYETVRLNVYVMVDDEI